MNNTLFKKCEAVTNLDFSHDLTKPLHALTVKNSHSTIPTAIGKSDDFWLKYQNQYIFYISDIHLENQIINRYPNGASTKEIRQAIKNIAGSLFHSANEPGIILFGGDIASTFEISKLFYSEFAKQCKQYACQLKKERNRTYNYNIYAILGNHELWEFCSFEDCTKAYQQLFDSLNICFLNNSTAWLGGKTIPVEYTYNKKKKKFESNILQREENRKNYDHQVYYSNDIVIVGGLGFAGNNHFFNADNGIYRETVNRKQEIQLTQDWYRTYKKAISYAKSNSCLLVVLTHNPIADWKETDSSSCGNVIYFYGHTHQNLISHDNENNIHVFADNQIGYHSEKVEFKEAIIFKVTNPYISLPDGYYQTTVIDCIRFNQYSETKIGNGGIISRMLENGAILYVVKHSSYYAFFMMSPKGKAYICAGGRVKKISDTNGDIQYYDKNFSRMIDSFILAMLPYRTAQEYISRAVKQFGGMGKIHGCIVDVSGLCHIMLNPEDGKITYYYSPIFGTVKSYASLETMLRIKEKPLYRNYEKQIESGAKNMDLTIFEAESENSKTSKLIQIDIGNSIYVVSGRINQIQRLFDANILRDWNEALLQNERKECGECEEIPEKTVKKIQNIT